jgi:hypothetical protein
MSIAEIRETQEVLTHGEMVTLESLEQFITLNMSTALQVAEALKKIHDEKLYRGTHSSFNQYVKDRFGIQKAHAYRMIYAGRTIEDLSGHPVAPESEFQIRPLANLDPGLKVEIWDQAVAEAGGEQPKPADIKKKVEEIKNKKPTALSPSHVDAAIAGDDDERAAISAEGSMSDPVVTDVVGEEENEELDMHAVLASIPVREKLSRRCREGFDIDVLAYLKFNETSSSSIRKIFLESDKSRPTGVKQGVFVGRLYSIHRFPHPRPGINSAGRQESGWLACLDCLDRLEQVSTGYMRGTTNDCLSCRGRGYTIPGA